MEPDASAFFRRDVNLPTRLYVFPTDRFVDRINPPCRELLISQQGSQFRLIELHGERLLGALHLNCLLEPGSEVLERWDRLAVLNAHFAFRKLCSVGGVYLFRAGRQARES